MKLSGSSFYCFAAILAIVFFSIPCNSQYAPMPGPQQMGSPLGNIIGGAIGSAVNPYMRGLQPMQPAYNPYAQMPPVTPIAAVPPSNPKKDAADELESEMAKRGEIMKSNPFYQIPSQTMKIRELATQNPGIMRAVGVYVVDIKKEEAFTPEDQKARSLTRGSSDIGEGKETPCSACKKNEDIEAKKELDNLMDPDKQKFIVKSMDPTQRSAYLEQEKAALKRAIRTQKDLLENAKKEMRKLAKDREQY